MGPTDRPDEYGEEEISYSHWGPKPVQPIIDIIYGIHFQRVSTFISHIVRQHV